MARKNPETNKTTKTQRPELPPELAAVAAKLPKNWYIIQMNPVKRPAKK